MYQSISFGCFTDAFTTMGRRDQFSYSGLRGLFDYLEVLEDDIGQPIELDVIALCCDYTEYDSAVEAATEYGWVRDPDLDDEENSECAMEWLQDKTTVIECDNSIIIQDF